MTLRNTLLCALASLKKSLIDRRVYLMFAILLCFTILHFSGINDFARASGYAVTPWMFPHLFTHPLLLPIFGFFLIFLFGHAPFVDGHTPFLMIRTGRLAWLLGQVIYIIGASFIFTFWVFIATILAFFPNIDFSADWGIVLRTLAMDPNLLSSRGFSPVLAISDNIMSAYTAIEATAISFMLLWIVASFIGMIILCFNIAVHKLAGIIVSSVFVFLSYFSSFIGQLVYGIQIYFFSPLNWASLLYLSWGDRGRLPSITFAVIVLLICVIMCIFISLLSFSKQDVQLSDELN